MRAAESPVFIFQMGKVGSTSLKLTLEKKYSGQVIHAHSYKHMGQQGQELLETTSLPISLFI